MHKNVLPLILTTALVAPIAALADASGFYIGGSYSQINYDDSDTTDDANIGVVSLRGGYQFDEGIAIEARVGTGISDDKVSLGDEKIKIEADDIYGIYVKAGVSTPVGLYPYILVGWTEVDLKASVPGDSVKDNGGDYSLGLGLDYRFNEQLSVGLEYVDLYDKDDYQVAGLSLGVNYKF